MKVYRVIRADEHPAGGLSPKNSAATYTPEGHILHGSRPGFASQYVSTTADIGLARQWAARTGSRIVEIDLTKVPAPLIDLTTPEGRDAYLRGIIAKNFAQAASEMLIDGPVPAVAITLIT